MRVRKDSVKLREIQTAPACSGPGSAPHSLDFIFDASARCSVSVVFVRGVHLPVSLQNSPLTDLGLPLIPLTFYDRGSSHVYALHGDQAYVDKYRQQQQQPGEAAHDEEIFIDFGKINTAIDAARAAGDARECVIKWDGSTVQGSSVSAHETGEVFQISPQGAGGGLGGSYIDVIIHLDAHNEHHINQQTKRDKRGRRRSTSQTTYVRFYRTEEEPAAGAPEGDAAGARCRHHQWHAVVLSQVVDAFTDLYEMLEVRRCAAGPRRRPGVARSVARVSDRPRPRPPRASDLRHRVPRLEFGRALLGEGRRRRRQGERGRDRRGRGLRGLPVGAAGHRVAAVPAPVPVQQLRAGAPAALADVSGVPRARAHLPANQDAGDRIQRQRQRAIMCSVPSSTLPPL